MNFTSVDYLSKYLKVYLLISVYKICIQICMVIKNVGLGSLNIAFC